MTPTEEVKISPDYDSYIIDVGSKSLKIYGICDDKTITELYVKSIPFKDDLKSSNQISEKHKINIIEILDAIKMQNPSANIKMFGTSVFRQLDPVVRNSIVIEIFQRTGVVFNIISQDLESFYLETALVDKCTLNEPIMIMNIGGGSTQLIINQNQQTIEKISLDIGVNTILEKFPDINTYFSTHHIDDVVEFVIGKLPDSQSFPRIALYNGGELTYMKLVGYPIEENILFKDSDHPFLIKTENFRKHNNKVFGQISFRELEQKMPQNPKWMQGARSCSALAQGICQKYLTEIIIPSDSNIAHGMARREFRRVTISGSYKKHIDDIIQLKRLFTERGIEVCSPRFNKLVSRHDEFVYFEEQAESGLTPLEIEIDHMHCIDQSDALIVCNPGGYVGISVSMEVGYAHARNIPIYFMEKPSDIVLNIIPASIGL